ncbi:MAG: nitrite reductase small subunit NirD [Beutenbergiaceae bacterium]
MSAVDLSPSQWIAVCALSDLAPERGAAAMVEGRQVAIFRLADDRLYAVGQYDPFSGANVMSRGIVGTRAGEPTVAGPMYKQIFSLRTGACLERSGYEPVVESMADLPSIPVQVRDGVVYLGVNATSEGQ